MRATKHFQYGLLLSTPKEKKKKEKKTIYTGKLLTPFGESSSHPRHGDPPKISFRNSLFFENKTRTKLELQMSFDSIHGESLIS